VLGLTSELRCKNCWSIAEHAGDASPAGMQHLLFRAAWDTDGVRDDLRGYVVDHLDSCAAVLVVDETGDLKMGTDTAGVQRQIHRYGRLIPLTCNEIHHLFNTLVAEPIHNLCHRLRCSTSRRQHQHRAKPSHYQRRATADEP
jgi:hypothetical protein